MTEATIKSDYWAHKGRFQKQYTELWEKLVPGMGDCETPHGEMLRAASRVYYDHYNNGRGNMQEDSYIVELTRHLKDNKRELALTAKEIGIDPDSVDWKIANFCYPCPDDPEWEHYDCDDACDESVMNEVIDIVVAHVAKAEGVSLD